MRTTSHGKIFLSDQISVDLLEPAYIITPGKMKIKLEIMKKRKPGVCGKKSTKRSFMESSLEFELDKLRQQLSSAHGGIFPHSILTTQQINAICAKRPRDAKEVSFQLTA